MKIFEKLVTENSRSYVLKTLLYNITNLYLEPGQKISENEISKMLGISRTPVREAIIEINRLGFIDIIPQKGSYISKIDYNIIDNCSFLRLMVEKEILKLACKGISESYIESLKLNLENERLAIYSDDIDKRIQLDNNFHRLIFEAVDKIWLYNIILAQMLHFDRLRILSLKSTQNKGDRTVKDHENILYSVINKDFELSKMLITKHLSRYKEEKELLSKHPQYFIQNTNTNNINF